MKFKLIEDYLDTEEKFFDYRTDEVNGQDIFDTKRGDCSFTQSFLNPEELKYRQKNKNQTAKIVQMSPEEYYEICAKRFGSSVDKLKKERGKYDKKIIDHLTEVITKYHKKFPITYIDYTTREGQEGLHRMFVAGELFGWDTKFPVLIIDWFDKERHEKDEKTAKENRIKRKIKNAIDNSLRYHYSDLDDFYEQIQWDLNNEFEFEVEGDVEFTHREEGNIGYITVDGVTVDFDLLHVKLDYEEPKDIDLEDIDIDEDSIWDSLFI